MPGRLPIRIPPIPHESLSSYLYRSAERNHIDVWKLSKLFLTNFKKPSRASIAQLDLQVDRLTSLSLVSQTLGLDTKKILDMTFNNVFNAFSSSRNMDSNLDTGQLSIRRLLETKHRRFCPECLQSNPAYYLVWQVKELKLCPVHRRILKDKCDVCGRKKKYSSMSTFCEFCNESLTHQYGANVRDGRFIDQQLHVYQDWTYLLEEHHDTMHDSSELFEKVLYLAQGLPSAFYPEIVNHIPERLFKKMLRTAINGEQFYVTLFLILKICRKITLGLQEFTSLEVPTGYTASLRDYLSRHTDPSGCVCVSPWCKYKDTSIAIKNIEQIKYKGRFYKSCICEGCYIKYTYEKGRGWREHEGLISDGWNRIVPLLNRGYSFNAISRELGMTTSRIIRQTGYFVRRNLVSSQAVNKYAPKYHPKKLVGLFRELERSSSDQIKLAKNMYGWSKVTYFYFYWSADVQKYLVFHSKLGKSRVRYELDKGRSSARALWTQRVQAFVSQYDGMREPLSAEIVAKNLNCSTSLLQLYGLLPLINRVAAIKKRSLMARTLWDKCEEYIQLQRDETILTISGFFTWLKLPQNTVSGTYPELYEHISSRIKGVNQEKRLKSLQELSQRIPIIIHDMRLGGIEVTQKSVATALGIDYKTLWRNSTLSEEYKRTMQMHHWELCREGSNSLSADT